MIPFTEFPDVAAERLGGAVLLANDEFFAPRENLLKAAKPVWREDEYTDRGKWMDGWETRRRRSPGHDWCVVRLGIPAIVRGVVVDTAFFRGNHPEHCSLDAVDLGTGVELSAASIEEGVAWREILPKSALKGDAANPFPVTHPGPVTHLRFNIFPDGGVARLRVHGEPLPSARLVPGASGDLAAMENGGLVVASSDMFFGHRHNLILPGRSTHMGDGWETRRRRGPGNDWSIVRLAARGSLTHIEVDTDHFKGNAPESCAIDIADVKETLVGRLTQDDSLWTPLVPRIPLEPNAAHRLDLTDSSPATHLRLAIYPDGGIARLRAFGTVT